MLPDILALLAGAVLLKVPLSTWPVINGALAIVGICWAATASIGYLTGLRGTSLGRRNLVYALALSPLAIYVAVWLTTHAA
jgi:hypothetical protein